MEDLPTKTSDMSDLLDYLNGEKVVKESLHRENDSIDDFEHLEHELSKNESPSLVAELLDDDAAAKGQRRQPRAAYVDDDAPINIAATPESSRDAAQRGSDVETAFATHTYPETNLFGTSPTSLTTKPSTTMDITANLLEMGDSNMSSSHMEPVNAAAAKDLTDDFMRELSYTDSPHTHDQPPSHDSPAKDHILNGAIPTQNLLDAEIEPVKIMSNFNDIADKFTDSEPEMDNDSRPGKEFESAEDLLRSGSPTANDFQPVDTFKDTLDEKPPTPSYFDDINSLPDPPKFSPVPPSDDDLDDFCSAPIIKHEPKPTPVDQIIEPTKTVIEPPSQLKSEIKNLTQTKKPEVGIMQAEEMFLKMGLDTWFHPERLHPTVEALIYWRNPQKSGVVFGGGLVILLSLAYFSMISVIANLSLLALTGTIVFRIYKNVMQAIQKTSDGHPFKEFLELDLTLPQDKVREVTDVVVAHINDGAVKFRRLFLVEDLIDSIKFGVFLWGLTYLGSWFNGMTLIIMGFVALFTVPKVYETNKAQIDANLDIVRTKLDEITSKVKAAIPIGKKSEEKKEQ